MFSAFSLQFHTSPCMISIGMMLSDSDDEFEMSTATKWFLMSGLFSNRRFKVHPLNQMREQLGECHHLFPQLRKDEGRFRKYMRMTMETFDYILSKVKPQLHSKRYSN
uniref:Putative E3 ubiquitin-protein ligase HUL4 n=1 Tax=Lygus hesperus TaxID=30085 RepID=A0A0A9XA24_LYGHE